MQSSNSIALETIQLYKKFGELTAVNNVSFQVEKGRIIGILGPNGAGKTTTIRLITGIFELEKDSKVKIYSKDLTFKPKLLKKEFGIVPETSNAYSDFSVWQNLKFSGAIYGLSKKESEKRANELLKRFELEDKKYSKTKTLSKGLKQRLNLCLALLHNPTILILDEPMSGLDPFSIKIVHNQIKEFKKEGKTILITTHNMQIAQNICDRVLIMNKGKIIADETPEKLRKKIKPSSDIIATVQGSLTHEQKKEINSLFEIIEVRNENIKIVSQSPLDDILKLKQFIDAHNLKINNFKLKESTLEDVFIYLIKSDTVKLENEKGGKNHG